MTTQPSLTDYLANLTSAQSLWGIWVNPENVDQYRIGQLCHENGGILDDWVCIGSLDRLSFGHQSQRDAIEEYLEQSKGSVTYKGKDIKLNTDGILEAWDYEILDEEFVRFLEREAKVIERVWSHIAAEYFVLNDLPDILEEANSQKSFLG